MINNDVLPDNKIENLRHYESISKCHKLDKILTSFTYFVVSVFVCLGCGLQQFFKAVLNFLLYKKERQDDIQ